MIYLSCGDNQQMKSLDVSACTALEEVNLYDASLETLIISDSQKNTGWLGNLKSQYPNLEIIVK